MSPQKSELFLSKKLFKQWFQLCQRIRHTKGKCIPKIVFCALEIGFWSQRKRTTNPFPVEHRDGDRIGSQIASNIEKYSEISEKKCPTIP